MLILDQILRYFHLAPMLLVFGGSALIAALRGTGADMRRAFSALRVLFTANPEADAYAAIAATGKIEKIAETRNIACADRIRTSERFLRRAARRLSHATDAQSFARWAHAEIAQREVRHRAVIAYWRAVAETAPAMGMIGTVIGLVQMFAALNNVEQIGSAMAMAMLTTLYGIILSAVIASPIAARFERLSAAELSWQRQALDRLTEIAEIEMAPVPARARPALRTVS